MADPTDVTGLVARWRADSIALANNAAVSSWTPLTGTGTLTQATGSLQPLYITSGINALPIVRFDGTDDKLAATVTSRSQPFSWVVVAQMNSTGQTQQVVSSGGEIMTWNAGDWRLFGGSALDAIGTVTTTASVLTGLLNGVSSALYLNGTSIIAGSGGTQTLGTALTIGNHPSIARAASVDIAEILLYDHALTAGERATVHTYVQTTYGITVSDYVSASPWVPVIRAPLLPTALYRANYY